MPETTAETQAQALASETRVAILRALQRHNELPVGDLAETVGVSLSAVSQQLTKLKYSGYVKGRRDAQRILYSVVPGAGSDLRAFLDTLS